MRTKGNDVIPVVEHNAEFEIFGSCVPQFSQTLEIVRGDGRGCFDFDADEPAVMHLDNDVDFILILVPTMIQDTDFIEPCAPGQKTVP